MALFPLPIVAEILVNGTWTDISRYVYQRDNITITGGLPPRGSTGKPPPAQITMTLNNRDGRFSPNYTGGAFYPYLKRNVQLRLSLSNATSSSGNTYSGYRFWGEVSQWPPQSDITGTDVYVQITASGPLRRIRRGGGKGSALTRYYASLTGAYAPVAYWPCEEDPDTTIVGAGIDGGTDMTVTVGTPKWKAVSDFNGSAPIGVLNGSTWDGLTGSFGASGDDVYTVPGTYAWVCPAGITAVAARCWGPAGKGGTARAVGAAGGGGGGGGTGYNASAAVTPGNSYAVVVTAGSSGLATTFTGDSVTVSGPAGGDAPDTTSPNGAGGAAGAAGTGGFAGGVGAAAVSGTPGGGGSSAGTSGAGNPGSGSTGGAAPAGGGAGGSAGHSGSSPGGGGGGGNWLGNTGAGAAGKVELVYSSPSVPNNNVIRFILFVPRHGGNNGKVLLRALTGGTVAKLEVNYVTGGKLQLKGYASGGTLLFDSGGVAFGVDGQTYMISVELANTSTNVSWKIRGIKPGDSATTAGASGVYNTASVGNVSEIIAAPNADITKTAMGHISLQYALVDLTKVSKALHGHHTEMGIDRFIRLCNEQALGNEPQFSETNDHWGFESGTQSWAATNATVAQSSVTVGPVPGTIVKQWPTEGNFSLLVTAAGGAGQWYANSPSGLSGQPVNPGDIVSAAIDVYTPAALGAVQATINWYNGAGTFLSTTAGATTATAAGDIITVKVTGPAPTGAATFRINAADNETVAAGTLMYVDHVRIHPRMGPQTRKKYHEFLEEIEDLDQGILKESKKLWGLGYRTRIALINQTPAVTLDYSQALVSPPLAPVVDDQRIKNHIVVHRHKGSKVTVTLDSGAMSVQEPPAGTGRYKRHHKTAAERDEQLLALAAHLLNLGTVSDERYPVITVNLARAGIAGHPLAPLMSAVAGVEIGDRVKISNLPFWYPSSTADQLVVGYTETISAFAWEITWNCVPASPWTLVSTAIRRW